MDGSRVEDEKEREDRDLIVVIIGPKIRQGARLIILFDYIALQNFLLLIV